MTILREEIPDAEVTILSRSSPDLAGGPMRGRVDLALLRPEPNTPGVHFETLIAEPLIVLMPADHRLTADAAIRPRDLAGERLIGVPAAKSPVLRRVTDAYPKAVEICCPPPSPAVLSPVSLRRSTWRLANQSRGRISGLRQARRRLSTYDRQPGRTRAPSHANDRRGRRREQQHHGHHGPVRLRQPRENP